MKQSHVQLKGFSVSETSRTYHCEVFDASGIARQFDVVLSLDLFKSNRLKFQDGPLIACERLEAELKQETETVDLLAKEHLYILEPDIIGYIERHYPPKARSR